MLGSTMLAYPIPIFAGMTCQRRINIQLKQQVRQNHWFPTGNNAIKEIIHKAGHRIWRTLPL